MKVIDSIYGEFDVNEKVLVDIINSSSIQRLKNISSAGFYPAYPEISIKYSNRYNHSIGVFLLLRKYNASIEEQIAGLIHDVNHTAFSHTIDYIIGTLDNQKSQNIQDNSFNSFIKNSEIATIIKKYNYNIDYILDDSHWTLKENNIPNICADRIDYSLRDGFICYKMITKDDINKILNSIVVYNGSFIFNNFEIAKFYADYFWKIDELYYSGIRSAVMFCLGAKLFKLAITKKYISISEFYKYDDIYIINKINEISKQDEEIKSLLNNLYLKVENYENNKNNYEEHTFCKVRRIDPKILINNKLFKLSDLDENYKIRISNINKYNEYFIKKIDLQ